MQRNLEEASTHNSAMTNTSKVFVPRDLDLSPFGLKINEFQGIMVDYVYVKFGEFICIRFEISRGKTDKTDRQTHTRTRAHTNATEHPTHARQCGYNQLLVFQNYHAITVFSINFHICKYQQICRMTNYLTVLAAEIVYFFLFSYLLLLIVRLCVNVFITNVKQKNPL